MNYLEAYNEATALASNEEDKKRASVDAELVEKCNKAKWSKTLVQKYQEEVASKSKKKSKELMMQYPVGVEYRHLLQMLRRILIMQLRDWKIFSEEVCTLNGLILIFITYTVVAVMDTDEECSIVLESSERDPFFDKNKIIPTLADSLYADVTREIEVNIIYYDFSLPFFPFHFSRTAYVVETSEFDPEADTPEERAQVEAACQHFYHNRFKAKPCADLLWCFQVLRENNFKQTIPSVTIEDGEEITYQKVTSAIRRGAHHLATLQTTDGHWPAQIVGPLFFLPPLSCFADHKDIKFRTIPFAWNLIIAGYVEQSIYGGYNIVMTTSLSSHVLVGYFSWAVVTVAFISNCDARNMRLQALEALEKSNIKIDSYGACHRNCDGVDKVEALKH
ncbi:hypothetical protein JHK82_050079 [Glycine max]|nr:hypothetical protein JHK82_050079 [Glycine max]